MSKNETLNLEVFDNPEFGRMRKEVNTSSVPAMQHLHLGM